MWRRMGAEFFGTFWLVFAGCGSAVLCASMTSFEIRLISVSLAFGLAVMTMGYAIGHISGAHLNPAVSLGLCVAGRMPARALPAYVVAQVLGAICASGLLFVMIGGSPDLQQQMTTTLGANGYQDHSPGKYKLYTAMISETVMTFAFVMIVLGSTDRRAPRSLAPLAIGLGLTLIHLVSIPVTGTSVNPARSTGPAVFAYPTWPREQLWLFWVAPLAGAILSGIVYCWLAGKPVVTNEHE